MVATLLAALSIGTIAIVACGRDLAIGTETNDGSLPDAGVGTTDTGPGDGDGGDGGSDGGGAWDAATAEKLRKNVFSVGNTIDPADGYRAFRGRDAGIDALMRDRGFTPPLTSGASSAAPAQK